jgi:predicted dehydrogenase
MQLMRLAVAGLGFMGSVHLKALRSIPEIHLAAVVSRDESKLAGDLSRTGGNLASGGEIFDFSCAKKYRDLPSVLSDSEIDAVDLCIPTDLHESAAIAALRAGKHVLVEKPMALSFDACQRMIAEARRSSGVLMVAQVLRFFPAYRVLVDAVKDLGAIRSATFRRRCARPAWADWQSDLARSGGAVLDLLIHDLDFVQRLFGAPQAVAATGRVEADVDIVSAQLFYASGLVVDVTGGWHPGKFPITMKYRVTGSDASIEFNFNQHPPRMTRQGVSHEVPLAQVAGYSAGHSDGYTAELAYFAECVRLGREPDLCRPVESADAVRLALAIIESRQRNGERISCKSE